MMYDKDKEHAEEYKILQLRQLISQIDNSMRFNGSLKSMSTDDICYINNMDSKICRKIVEAIKTI